MKKRNYGSRSRERRTMEELWIWICRRPSSPRRAAAAGPPRLPSHCAAWSPPRRDALTPLSALLLLAEPPPPLLLAKPLPTLLALLSRRWTRPPPPHQVAADPPCLAELPQPCWTAGAARPPTPRLSRLWRLWVPYTRIAWISYWLRGIDYVDRLC